MRPLTLAFMGTPDFAVSILDALLADPAFHVACVYSQPPRPADRGQKLRPSPVQLRAEAAGIPVRHPTSLRKPEPQAEFSELGLDAAVVAAYGLILPRPILEAPRLGCLNVHASFLPRWRGAAPIQRAILAGDTETGVTIMQMDEGLDTGGMLLADRLPITPETTATTLHDALAALGARLIGPALKGVAAGTLQAIPQPSEGVTYAAKLEKAEGRLDVAQPASLLDRQVRALTPWPGCWVVTAGSGETLKVLATRPRESAGSAPPGTLMDEACTIACGEGTALTLLTVQRPGRAPVDGAAFLRGFPVAVGEPLALPAG